MKRLYRFFTVIFVLLSMGSFKWGYSRPLVNKQVPVATKLVIARLALLAPAAPQNATAPKDSTASEKVDKKVQKVKQLFSFGIILTIIITIAVTYVLVRLLEYIIDSLAERFTNYRLKIKRLIPIFRILLWIIALYIIIAGIISPDISTLITVVASVGIAVGLASQEILKNIFGGIMIILDKPFQVGDKITIVDYYGEVQQIGLRSTRLVTPDDSVVSVPNGDAISKSISNMNSSNLYGQVVAEIYLPARVDVAKARQIARRAAISSRYVYLNKPVAVIAQNEIHEKNFVLKLRVKAYVLDIRYEFPFRSDMTEQILGECNRQGMMGGEAASLIR